MPWPMRLAPAISTASRDVVSQALRRHHAHGQFAGMQAQARGGPAGLEELDHAHVQHVVAHGDLAVLRADDVHASQPARAAPP